MHVWGILWSASVISLFHGISLNDKKATQSLSCLKFDDPQRINAGHISVIMDPSKPMSWTVGRADVEPLIPTGWKCSAGVLHCIMSVSWSSDEAVRIMPNDTWLTTCIYRIYSLRQGATSKTCLSFSFSKSCACDALEPEFNAWLLVITFRNTIELILLLATWCQGGMAFPERHSAVALWEISQQDLGSRKPTFCWI